MNKTLDLPRVTLLGIDCLNLDRLDLAAQICTEHIHFAEVKLLTSQRIRKRHRRFSIIPIELIDSIPNYSDFVISRLDEFVDTDYVLIIQYDGFILNAKGWNDEFLRYDYIGAPWKKPESFITRNPPVVGPLVGNGGFSLRSKKLLTTCAQLYKKGAFKPGEQEDIAICMHQKTALENDGICFAPPSVAERFSIEGPFDERSKWSDQFGFHSLRFTDIDSWKSQNRHWDISSLYRKPRRPITTKRVFNYLKRKLKII
jgi:Protein of unknown function (DUF5672)